MQSRKQKKVLVVDDNKAAAEVLKIQLENLASYEVRTVYDGRCALQTGQTFHPDFVVLDVQMPETDGGTVAAQFQHDPALRKVPIAFLTSLVTEAEIHKHGTRPTGEIFFAKPVNLKKLVQHIEMMC